MSGVFPAGVSLRLLEIWLQAIQLWPYRADPLTRHPIRLGMTASFLACCCPRVAFRRRVSHRIQRYTSHLSPLHGGYNTAPHCAEVVEAAQHRFAMRAHRRSIRPAATGRSRKRSRGAVRPPAGPRAARGCGAASRCRSMGEASQRAWIESSGGVQRRRGRNAASGRVPNAASVSSS